MSHDPLDYSLLLQDALRGLVRSSLEIVAEQGLPGEHHFFLSFRTDAPGVVLAPQLKQSYPEEMTIVLKTQFQELVVDDDAFSVGLFFSGVRHYLTIPFAALLSFSDPSVGFQVAFQPLEEEEDGEKVSAADREPSEETPGDGEPVDNVVAFPGSREKT